MNSPLFVVGLLIAGLGVFAIFGFIPGISGSILPGAIAGLPNADAVVTAECGGCTAQTVSLTTSAPDVVMLIVSTTSASPSGPWPTVTSVSGLTFTLRHTFTPVTACGPFTTEMYSVALVPLTAQSITVTVSSSSPWALIVFAVSGANTATPFDSGTNLGTLYQCNANLGTIQNSPPYSTTGGTDFVFMVDATSGNPTFAPNAPMTTLGSTIIPSWAALYAGGYLTTTAVSNGMLSLNTNPANTGSSFVDAINIGTATTTSTSTSTTSTISSTSTTTTTIPTTTTSTTTTTTTVTSTITSTTSTGTYHPVIVMSPNPIAAGQSGTLSGTGFQPSSVTTLSAFGSTVPGPNTDASGSFTFTLTVPSTAFSGANTITVTDSGGHIASTSVTVGTSNSKGFPIFGFMIFGAGLVVSVAAVRIKPRD